MMKPLYQFTNYKIKTPQQSGIEDGGFAMLIPSKSITKEELKQFTINKLYEIITDTGIKFYQVKSKK